ncbi:ABC transporter permease subunit [Luteimonas composti]|uniref:ABC transporter permease subunit n=1 Tax=Luteimonas composti TaxID=398257 RepID=A0ABT6MVU6_9GAMM|nr:ABC transporter permease subunit [Luteimonas composti]MDH7454722.1 ABC transporter permease subunit [Luteimonas composti]
MLWLGLFFAVPFLIVARISFAEAVFGQVPPYTPLLEQAANGAVSLRVHISSYALLLQDPLYVAAYLRSLLFAGVSTLFCLLIGYPMAYGIARAKPVMRLVLMMLVILPFWTSSLLRTYAMIGIFKANGWLSAALAAVGVLDPGEAVLHSNLAVYIGIVYNYLPFMVLPLAATLMRLDFTLLDAASDLGARPWQGFLRITLPLSMPGIIAGCLLVFIPAVGEFVIPDLLGGPDALTIGRVLWTEFFTNRDWPLASAVAVAMLLLIVIPTLVFEYLENRREQREATS